MGFLKKDLVKMNALVHLLLILGQALLPLLEQITFVNQVLLMRPIFSAFTMNVYGMEKGVLFLETHAACLIPRHTSVHDYKLPQVIILKDGYADMKIKILGTPVL